ncbi:hypothetical protein KF840_16855 [bacterium]|nr:hypothetical protein [bacterium]
MRRVPLRLARAALLVAGALLASACPRAAPAPDAARAPRRVELDPADPARLLVVERGGGVGIWRVDDAAAPRGERWLDARATDARFLAGGLGVVSGGADGRVRRWSRDGRDIWTSAAGAPIRALAASPDAIAAAGEDGRIRLWTLAGAPAGELATDAGILLAVAWSPRGDWLAAEGADTRLRLWRRDAAGGAFVAVATFRPIDARYAQLVPNLVRHDVAWGWDRSLAFAPDGASLIAADFGGAVERWRLNGERDGALPSAGPHHIRALAVAPDGRVAAAAHDGTLRVWPADGGEPAAWPGHEGSATGIAFAADGSRLASAGLDGRVVLWRSDGERLGALPSAR